MFKTIEEYVLAELERLEHDNDALTDMLAESEAENAILKKRVIEMESVIAKMEEIGWKRC